jgi:hypothetical protein
MSAMADKSATIRAGLCLGGKQSHEKASPVGRANEVFLAIVLPLALMAAMLEEASFTDWGLPTATNECGMKMEFSQGS